MSSQVQRWHIGCSIAAGATPLHGPTAPRKCISSRRQYARGVYARQHQLTESGTETTLVKTRLLTTISIAWVLAGFGLVLQAQNQQAVNTWRSIGDSAETPAGAASIALADGRTLVAGGVKADGSFIRAVI